MSFTEQQKAYHLRKMRTRMHRLDSNQDGYLSVEDFELMAQKLVEHGSGISAEKRDQINTIFPKIAEHYMGLTPGVKIEVEEAAKIASESLLCEKKEKISPHDLLFDCIDTNNDGHISREEFAVYFKVTGGNLTPDEIKHSFDTIDSNGDGEISREEYVAAAHEFYFGVEETEVSNVFYGKLVP